MKKSLPKKIWIPAIVLLVAGYLFFYNRPVMLQKAVLMSTPLIFRDGLVKPYEQLPADIQPPEVEVLYATDRQPSDTTILNPIFFGNGRSMSLSLGKATVRFGDADMPWSEVENVSLQKNRSLEVPLQVIGTAELSTLGAPTEFLEDSMQRQTQKPDHFNAAIQERLDHSKVKDIYIFVPGFKVDFAYPVLVAAELWHYMGYRGVFIAYSWPSGQRLLNYLADLETTAFTAQHLRMLLIYLALNTQAERIHILCYSAGARIVSQALHEIRLMAYGIPLDQLRRKLKIGQVIFAAPDIDLMLFTARYRDRFEEIADRITIYTNANDTALNWALRFLGWPRLGAPGEMGLRPEDLISLELLNNSVIIDVAAAEDAASGNGHGYFIKSPWVSTDLLLALAFGGSPAKRGLSLMADGTVWEFSDDYPRQIRRLAGETLIYPP